MSRERDVFAKVLEYLERVERMVESFVDAIDSLNDMDINNAYKHLADSIRMDTEADAFRRDLMKMLSEAPIDRELKDDIAKLLRMLDKVSEWIKEASRYLNVIPYLEIPYELKMKIEDLTKLDTKAIRTLVLAFRSFVKKDYDKTIKLCEEIEKIEEEADEVLHVARKNLVAYGPKIGNVALIVMLRDFIEALENATDYAEDVSDILRIMVFRALDIDRKGITKQAV